MLKAAEADAGPLIGLVRIQQLQLLRHLFTTIWITEVIAAEIGLTPGFAGPHGFPGNGFPYSPLNPDVDAGEASAIGYALEQTASGCSRSSAGG